MLEPITNSQSIDLNVVPVSIEATLLSMFDRPLSLKSRLREEIIIQEELLSLTQRDTPEYQEIKANLDEAFQEFWSLSNWE